MAALSQPVLSTLHDVLDLTGHVDRYGSLEYLRGIVVIYEAMTRKQPHFLSRADLERLGSCVAVCTEGWPREMVEAKTLQAKISSLHQLIDNNVVTCVIQILCH